MDGNVTIYHRYIVEISGVEPSRHDISKRKSNEEKIGKYRPISANIGDISDTISVTNAVHGKKKM